jgi:hypothetical protein
MRVPALLIAIVCAGTRIAASQQCGSPPPAEAAAQVRVLNQQYIEAARANNPAWFRRHMAEDVVVTLTSGRQVGKPEFLMLLRQEPKSYRSLTVGNVTVRPAGQMVEVEAEAAWELSDGSKGVVRYLDTYTWLDCRWQVHSAKIASLPHRVVRKRRYRSRSAPRHNG